GWLFFGPHVAPIEPSANEVRRPRFQHLSEQVLDSTPGHSSDLYEVTRLKPVPCVAEKVADVLDRNRHQSSSSSCAISFANRSWLSNQYSRRSGSISVRAIRLYQASSAPPLPVWQK